jgi:hypothetical protein
LIKLRHWLIKKLIGETPVIMNVTLRLDDIVMGAKPDGIMEKSNISYSDRFMKEGGVQ